MRHEQLRLPLLACIAAIAAGACADIPGLRTKARKPSRPVTQIVAQTAADGSVSGTASASAEETQVLTAESGVLSGTSLALPPGAIGVDTVITMREGAPLADAGTLSELGIAGNTVESSGTAVLIDPGAEIDLATPGTVKLPIPAGAALTAAAQGKLAVLYRVKVRATGTMLSGLLPESLLVVKDGLVAFEILNFGIFQIVYLSTPITTKLEVPTTKPVLAKDAPGQPGSGNAVPVAEAQALAATEDKAATGVLRATDAESDALTYAIVTQGTKGAAAVTDAATGAFKYTPNPDAVGIDTFTFKARDATGDSSPATVTVTIAPVNDAPVASALTLTVTEDVAQSGTLPGTDVDGDTLVFSVTTQGTKGTAAVTNNATGAFTYTPNLNVNGADSFTFKVTDGKLNATAVVTVTITAVNDAPVANASTLPVTEDTPANGTLTGSDVEGAALTFSIVTQGAKGTATVTNAATGAYTYTPNANANGTDTFTFKVNDGALDSSPAAITVNIAPVDDAPIATADSYNVAEDVTLTRNAAMGVLANDVEPDGSPMTAVLQTDATYGTLTLNANGSFTYVPDPDWNGTDSFTYKASDGTLQSATTTVTITVDPVNDTPTFVAIANQMTPLDTAIVALPFQVDEGGGPDEDTQNLTVAATSSDTSVIPNANIAVSYTSDGASDATGGTVTITPASGAYGIVTITLTATDDGAGMLQGQVTFQVNVVGPSGSGVDGDVVVTGLTTTDDTTLLGRTLSASRRVTSINGGGGDYELVTSTPFTSLDFAPGDEILWIMTAVGQSPVGCSTADRGRYGFATVTSVDTILDKVVIPTPPGSTPNGDSYGTSSNCTMQIVRVPNFRDLTISTGATLKAMPFNDATGSGGILALRVSRFLDLDGGSGAMSVAGKGFRGGPDSGPVNNAGGSVGKSSFVSQTANGNGGGGAHNGGFGAGGGANHGLGGNGANNSGSGGISMVSLQSCSVYCDPSTRLFFGGGGGKGNGQAGGDGGGILLLFAEEVRNGSLSLLADGVAAGPASTSLNGPGGGAGGTVVARFTTIDDTGIDQLSSLTMTAKGSQAHTANTPDYGGGGGGGGLLNLIYSGGTCPATKVTDAGGGTAGAGSTANGAGGGNGENLTNGVCSG